MLLVVFLVSCMTFSSYMHSITFENLLDKKAGIEIFISVDPQEPPTILAQPNTSQPIARYAFVHKPDSNKILLWQTLHTPFTINFFGNSRDINSVPVQTTNPFTITLTRDEIQHIIEQELEYIYLLIVQRTYFYNTTEHMVLFFDYEVLYDGYVSLDAAVEILAQGVIAPNQMPNLPDSLKMFYTVAQGQVIVH